MKYWCIQLRILLEFGSNNEKEIRTYRIYKYLGMPFNKKETDKKSCDWINCSHV